MIVSEFSTSDPTDPQCITATRGAPRRPYHLDTLDPCHRRYEASMSAVLNDRAADGRTNHVRTLAHDSIEWLSKAGTRP